jgi:hypothetical protein
MKEKFEDVLRKELKKELNQSELKNVIKEYKKIKKFQKTPLYQVMQMDKKEKK